jgi:NitT/TauT family transport system substrate-binding protein
MMLVPIRHAICAGLIVTLALLLPPAPTSAQSTAAPLVTLHLGATPDDDVAPILYAQKAGLFARAGLNVILDKSPSGAAAAAAVLAGTYDIAKSSLVNLMSAHVKGVPFTLIAPAGMWDDSTPFAQLLVLRDSPIRSAKDLNGKLLSVPALHDIGQVSDSAWVEAHGGDSRTLRFVEFPMAGASAALDQHRIDATTIVGPAMDAAMASGKFRSLGASFGAIAPHFLFSGWFTTKEWAAAHADIAKRFVRVWAEAAAYANGHHDDTEPLLAQFTLIPIEILHKMTRGVYGTTLSAADIQPVIDVAAKYQMIERSFPAQELIDPGTSAR